MDQGVIVPGDLQTFAETERRIWHLAAGLWDHIDLGDSFGEMGGEDDTMSVSLTKREAYIMALDRRALVEKWIQKFTSEISLQNIRESKPPHGIFYRLVSGQFEAASQAALAARDFRLATLVSFLFSTISFFYHYFKLPLLFLDSLPNAQWTAAQSNSLESRF